MNAPRCCDYCDAESEELKRLHDGPFPPMVCPECYAIASDGPTDAQLEAASDPCNRPLTPLENYQQNDEHNVS